MRYLVYVRENNQWQQAEDGTFTRAQAERIAREIRRECHCKTIVLPDDGLSITTLIALNLG